MCMTSGRNVCHFTWCVYLIFVLVYCSWLGVFVSSVPSPCWLSLFTYTTFQSFLCRSVLVRSFTLSSHYLLLLLVFSLVLCSPFFELLYPPLSPGVGCFWEVFSFSFGNRIYCRITEWLLWLMSSISLKYWSLVVVLFYLHKNVIWAKIRTDQMKNSEINFNHVWIYSNDPLLHTSCNSHIWEH